MSDFSNKTYTSFLFGPFRLSTSTRTLFEGDRVVRLGGKATDILIALVARAGDLMSKHELFAIAWPNTFVVEANLTVQVAALRRALGEDESANPYIVNIPGRGYRFVAPIKAIEDRLLVLDHHAASENHNLPAQLTRLVGRTEALGMMAQKISSDRLVSIVGPPGVGKTALALRLAEGMLQHFRHGVWFIDLASISEAALVPSALVAALPIDVRSSDVLSGIAAQLRFKNQLLIFDNCEHVVDGAAAAISELLRAAPDIKIVATSREPLRIKGEQVCRVAPLELPPPATKMISKDVLAYPAVQLFVERATAIVNDFELTAANASFAAQICSRLDGNPLAIEVAAARVDAFDLEHLAARIVDRMQLLSEVHRGTPARHRTIAAALEWSYQLLSDRERFVLRCLTIFTGSFTLEAALAVISDSDEDDTASVLADLVCKSLLSVEIGTSETRFRLLEITKAFAAKLIDDLTRNELDDRLSSYLSPQLNPDREDCVRTTRAALQDLDQVRGILGRAFASGGRSARGVEMTAQAVPVWLENSLLTECIGWTSKAIAVLQPADIGARKEMVLKAAFGLSIMFTMGMTTEAREALDRAIAVAERLGESQWQLSSLVGLAVFFHRRGDLKRALCVTESVERLAANSHEPTALGMMTSIKSASLFLHGKNADALKYARTARAHFRDQKAKSPFRWWGLDYSLYAQCVITRVYWTHGLFDKSLHSMETLHAEAEASGNPIAICQAHTWCACSLLTSLEDFDGAAQAIGRLRQVSEDHDLRSYHFSSIGFEGALLFMKGQLRSGEVLLRKALSKLDESQYENLYVPFLGTLAELLAADGRSEEALSASTESLERTTRNEAHWWLPDALRIHGAVLGSSGSSDPALAESYFRQSIAASQGQGALGWELGAAYGLAKLLAGQGREVEAAALMNVTLCKFVEGFDSTPYRRARAYLDSLRKEILRKHSDQRRVAGLTRPR